MNIKKGKVVDKSSFNNIKPEPPRTRTDSDILASRPPKEFVRQMYSGMTSYTGITSTDQISRSFSMGPGFENKSEQPRYVENNGKWIKIKGTPHFTIERNSYTNEIRKRYIR